MFKHTRGQDKFINTNEDLLIDLCENCLIDYFAKALIELETKDKEYKSLIKKQENILETTIRFEQKFVNTYCAVLKYIRYHNHYYIYLQIHYFLSIDY